MCPTAAAFVIDQADLIMIAALTEDEMLAHRRGCVADGSPAASVDCHQKDANKDHAKCDDQQDEDLQPTKHCTSQV